MNKISLIVFLLMSSYLSAAGLYPYASRPKELKPLAPTIFLKEQANEFKLEKSKNAKAAITDWKDLKEELMITQLMDLIHLIFWMKLQGNELKITKRN